MLVVECGVSGKHNDEKRKVINPSAFDKKEEKVYSYKYSAGAQRQIVVKNKEVEQLRAKTLLRTSQAWLMKSD